MSNDKPKPEPGHRLEFDPEAEFEAVTLAEPYVSPWRLVFPHYDPPYIENTERGKRWDLESVVDRLISYAENRGVTPTSTRASGDEPKDGAS